MKSGGNKRIGRVRGYVDDKQAEILGALNQSVFAAAAWKLSWLGSMKAPARLRIVELPRLAFVAEAKST